MYRQGFIYMSKYRVRCQSPLWGRTSSHLWFGRPPVCPGVGRAGAGGEKLDFELRIVYNNSSKLTRCFTVFSQNSWSNMQYGGSTPNSITENEEATFRELLEKINALHCCGTRIKQLLRFKPNQPHEVRLGRRDTSRYLRLLNHSHLLLDSRRVWKCT